MKVQILKHRCPQNHSCPAVNVCPVNAITQGGFSAPRVDDDKCINCGRCTFFCPTGAIQKG